MENRKAGWIGKINHDIIRGPCLVRISFLNSISFLNPDVISMQSLVILENRYHLHKKRSPRSGSRDFNGNHRAVGVRGCRGGSVGGEGGLMG